MPTRQVPELPWIGGLDRSRPSIISDRKTAYNLKNIRVTDQGIKRVRGGLRSYYHNSDGDPVGAEGSESSYDSVNGVKYLMPYRYGTKYRLLAVVGDGLYYRTIGGYERVGGSSLVTNPVQMMQFSERTLITALATTDGTSRKSASLYSWSGSDEITKMNNAPNPRFIRTHYNRLIASGSYQEPTIWYGSFVGDPNNWEPYSGAEADNGGFIAEIPGNRSITGISPSHYTGFYISTVESIHFINGRAPSEYQHSLVAEGIGNFGHHTLVNIRGMIMGWNHEGCYLLTDSDRQGGVTSMEMSAPIREVFRQMVHRVPEEFFSVDNYADGEYVTFMPHLQNNSYTVAMIYNYRYQQWYWYEIPIKIKSACMWNVGHDAMMLMGNDECFVMYFQNGQLKDLQDVTDYETDFEVQVETHRILIGNAQQEAHVTAVGAMINDNTSKNFDVTYWLDRDNDNDIKRSTKLIANPSNKDELDSTFKFGSSRLGDDEDVVILKSYEGGYGRYGKLQIKENAADLGDLKIYGLFFDFEGGGPVR